jgi:DNA modification methylase
MADAAWSDGLRSLYHGPNMEVLADVSGGTYDAIVTDPPYGLSFMGKKWDYDVPSIEIWQEALRVLKPGGWLLCFAGARTQHRMAVNVEDAGFEIRDCLMWLYSQGFPKGTGTLKPAYEPIILARKKAPAPTLNIDKCRIPTSESLNSGAYCENEARRVSQSVNPSGLNRAGATTGREFQQPEGRWPANVILDEGAGALLDEQTGFLQAGNHPARRNTSSVFTANAQGDIGEAVQLDGGGASRFFYCAKADRAEREMGMDGCAEKPLHRSAGTQNPGSFQAEGTKKAAKNFHPTVKPVDLMRWLVRLVTPHGGKVLDPFCGSGTTGIACVLEGVAFDGIDIEADYLEIAARRIMAAQPNLWEALNV